MSSAGWHCKSIVKAFMRRLEEHGALPLSVWLSSFPVRGRGSISSSRCLYKSEQVRTLRHAVGVIITLEDYNDTPLWTRSPVSTVIKQLLSLWLKGLIWGESLCVRARLCACVWNKWRMTPDSVSHGRHFNAVNMSWQTPVFFSLITKSVTCSCQYKQNVLCYRGPKSVIFRGYELFLLRDKLAA